jgi:hypothetical protein
MCNVAANHCEGEAVATVERLDWNEPQAAACEVRTLCSLELEPKCLIRVVVRLFLHGGQLLGDSIFYCVPTVDVRDVLAHPAAFCSDTACGRE